jgi:hypothetical protein
MNGRKEKGPPWLDRNRTKKSMRREESQPPVPEKNSPVPGKYGKALTTPGKPLPDDLPQPRDERREPLDATPLNNKVFPHASIFVAHSVELGCNLFCMCEVRQGKAKAT